MPLHLVILSSDVLFWLLIVGVILAVIWVRQQPVMLRPWRQVLASPIACVCMVVLLMYSGITLLDSIHFQQADSTKVNKVQSVLDWIMSPVSEHTEKTYSSPFATDLFNKTVFKNSKGETVRGYAPLQFAYQPKSETDQIRHISLKVLQGFIIGLAFSLSVCALWILVNARFKKISFKANLQLIRKGHCHVAARSLILSFVIIVSLLASLYSLSTGYHLFGTDKVGGDVFYETIKSIRAGILIGSLTTIFMLPFAIMLGMMAGYFGGLLDDIIQFSYTVLSSIPGVLLISAAILALQLFINHHPDLFPTLIARADARLLALCAILGVTSWTGLCRLLRAETFKLRELDFISAADSLGTRKSKILLKHILPNIFHIVVIKIVLDFSGLVLAEAVLSYVGVGVDPTMMSWGNMINSARLELAREPVVWWPLISAMIFMFILVLSLNLFADKVRDAFDPRMNA